MKKVGLVVLVLFVLMGILYLASLLASNKVLTAFETLDNKIVEANQTTQAKNDSLLQRLTQLGSFSKNKAIKLQHDSHRLDTYIEELKMELLKNHKYPGNEGMSASSTLDALFFDGDNLTPRAKEFIFQINNYKNQIDIDFAEEFPNITEQVWTQFDTSNVVNNLGVEAQWLVEHFKGLPLIASVTKLSQMQTDVENIENQLLLGLQYP